MNGLLTVGQRTARGPPKSVSGRAYDTHVTRRRLRVPSPGLSHREASQDATVRRYLRAVVGAPTSQGDTAGLAESAFVEVAADWSDRVGVDRHALLALGVDGDVLDAAGVTHLAANQRLRRFWGPEPFSVADLARRSGMSAAVVRRAIALDEEAGLLRRVGRDRSTILFGVA